MWKCRKCNEYRTNQEKSCSCKNFTVINEVGDRLIIRAMHNQDAALKFAQESNEKNDYYLMGSQEKISINGTDFLITAETDVNYYASEM